MIKEFIPYQESKDLEELGFDEPCLAFYGGKGDTKIYFNLIRDASGDYEPFTKSERLTWFGAPLYQQAFRFFREKYEFTYSIGKTNIVVCHTPVSTYDTTQLLQDNATYEDAELATIRFFIENAKTYETNSN
jgi:hypothetical protein